MKFLILNGPNLNIMRWSEPGVPGELDYNAIMDYVQAGCEQLGIETDCCQTNHEGDLVDEIQAAAGRVDGIVLNPGAYAHYSVAILDALRLCGVPAVEVMLHAPDEREPFRKMDVVSFGCQGHFIGEGPQGYLHACIYLAQLLRTDGSSKAHIVM
jgi:3-dehydroquinate dehydratase-2